MTTQSISNILALIGLSLLTVSASQAQPSWSVWGSSNTSKPAPQPAPVASAPSSPQPTSVAPAPTVVQNSSPQQVQSTPPQQQEESGGFYARLGLGYGVTKTSGKADNGIDVTISGNGLSLDAVLGGTVAKGVMLGGTIIMQRQFSPTVTIGNKGSVTIKPDGSYALLGAIADFNFGKKGGFHLSTALGLASISLKDDNDNTIASSLGVGASVSLGYDFRIGEKWWLGLGIRSDAAYVEKGTVVSSGSLMVNVLYY